MPIDFTWRLIMVAGMLCFGATFTQIASGQGFRVDRSTPLTDAQRAEITQTIAEVDRLIDGVFEKPQGLTVEFVYQSDNAAFHRPGASGYAALFANSLVLPYYLGKRESVANQPKYRRALVAHEYAHAVLEYNSRKRHEFWLEVQRAKQRQKKITEQEKNGLITVEEADARYANISDKLFKLKSRFLDFHELFADTVGVMIAKDPTAMRRVTEELGRMKARRSNDEKYIWASVARDFAIKHKVEDWMASDSHPFYAGVRSILGSVGVGNLPLEANKRFLSVLFEVADLEIATELQRSQEVVQANESFGRRLRERLAFPGLEVSFPETVSACDLATAQHDYNEEQRLIHQAIHSGSPIATLKRLLGGP